MRRSYAPNGKPATTILAPRSSSVGLIAFKEPQDPVEAIRPTLDDLGAKIVVAGFPFGEYDLLIVYEAPDDMTAASVAMAVAAAGEVKSAKTTRLLSGPEWLESLRNRRLFSPRKASETP